MTELRDAPVDRRGQGGTVADVGHLGEGALALFCDEPGGFVKILGPGQRVFVGFDV